MLQLKYFSELAKRQHLNKTAQEMLVTPSAISSSLARLEKEMGVKLFDRVGRNIRLNNYGKILQKYVDQVFYALDSAETEIKEAQNLGEASVSVAVTNPNLWNNPLRAFSAEHPEISISLLAFDTGTNSDYSGRSNPLVENADFYIATTGEIINPSMNSNTSFSLIPRCFWLFRRLTDLPGGHGSIWRRPKTSGLSIPLTIPLFGIFAIVSASRQGLRRNRGSSATISCAQECSSVKIWSVLPLRRDRTAGCMTALS